MHTRESVKGKWKKEKKKRENLLEFEIQTNPVILAEGLDLVIVQKEKICQTVGGPLPVDHRI